MPFILADRVKDTTTSTGTGNITVSGTAPTGFQTLSAALTANDDTTFLAIAGGAEWETSLATRVSANVYERTTILESSNAGNAVNFSAGTKDVFITAPASKIATTDYVLSDSLASKSSGVLTGGALSIGTGGAGVATTFTIAAGTGQIVDNTVSPTTVTAVTWSAQTDVAVTNILTQLVTYVALDSSGNVIQQGSDWTPAQQRQYIVIGIVVHSAQTVVNAVNQTHIVAYAPGAQVNDLMYAMGLFNISGNVFSSNGSNLKLNKSAGTIFRRGSSYTSLSSNPHIVTTGALTQASLRMQNQTGAGSASTTDVDVANYDLAGVTTAISPATRFSILRVFLFQSNLIAVQRGQAVYQSLAEAKAAIQTEPFVTNSILAANGLLRGFVIAQANASSLADTGKCFFIEAGRFGGSTGVGGLSVSTLQNAYDNSSSPEILTDATRLGVTIRRGSGADSDVVLETQNGAGTTTFSMTGAGDLILNTVNGNKIGTATSQKLGFYNAAPVVQPTAVADATGAGDVVAQLNSLLARMRNLGLIAT